MAKSLRESPPSSSVARLLDPLAANRAIAVPTQPAVLRQNSNQGGAHSGATATLSTPDLGTVKREMIFSVAADDALSCLIQAYRRATRTRLGASHIVRAMLVGVAHAMPELEREIHRLAPMKLPSNARGFEQQRAQFENKLAATFVAGMRAAATLNAGE